jgi:type VI secretion system Hcp family effector
VIVLRINRWRLQRVAIENINGCRRTLLIKDDPTIKEELMLQFKRLLISSILTASTFILPSLFLTVQTAQAKDNNAVQKIRVRVQVTNITGDGPGGSIEAFGSDEQITIASSGGGGGGAGKAVIGPLVITKDVDSASPQLVSAALTGRHIQQVKVDLIRKNPVNGEDQVYLSILLTDVLIDSLRTRVADQRDPQSLQGATVEDVGFTAVTTQFSYLQPNGTLLNVN